MPSQNRIGYHKRLVAFPKALDEKLKTAAIELGDFQICEIVRIALVEYLERHEEKKKNARIEELERQLAYYRETKNAS